MNEKLGAGIELDESFDFSVDQTGDIGATIGAEELEKDLAFQMAISLRPFLGSQLSGSDQSQAKNAAIRVATSDPRIASVSRDSVSVVADHHEEVLNIEMGVTTTTQDNYTLVFEV